MRNNLGVWFNYMYIMYLQHEEEVLVLGRPAGGYKEETENKKLLTCYVYCLSQNIICSLNTI